MELKQLIYALFAFEDMYISLDFKSDKGYITILKDTFIPIQISKN